MRTADRVARPAACGLGNLHLCECTSALEAVLKKRRSSGGCERVGAIDLAEDTLGTCKFGKFGDIWGTYGGTSKAIKLNSNF